MPSGIRVSGWIGIPSLFRIGAKLGIAARLGVAFIAVAVLAIAANMIAVRGTLIFETKEVQPVLKPRPSPEPIHQPATSPRPAQVSTALALAIDRFADAVLKRVDEDSPQGARELSVAAGYLTNEAAASRAERGRVSPQLRPLQTEIATHQMQATQLVSLADMRRRLYRDYTHRFEAMDTRVRASLDGAFKIFGRIIARASLIELSQELDDMRADLAHFATPNAYDAATVSAIAVRETQLAATLQQNERGLVRSQGEQWHAQMRDDLANLVEIRKSLIEAEKQRRAALDRFSAVNTELAVLARGRPASQPLPASVPVDTASPATMTATTSEAQGSIAATSRWKEDGQHSALIGWISGSVLVLLLFISVGTAMSIVAPVRRLMVATRRVADGQTQTRVPRGGIKELDLLALSFNQMAEQLSAAKAVAEEYHQQLEARVEDRTRQLQHLAEHDPLTQLPNRRQLLPKLTAALRAAEKQGLCLGVFFIDLDNFKNINDSVGHTFGDRILQSMAQRLTEAIGSCGFAARLGGDEFTIVYEGARNVEEIREAGWALVRAFQRPLHVEGRDLLMSISVGASVYPDHEQEAEALLRAADAALFRAKALGRSQICMFSRELFENAASKFSTEQGLRRAVERGEFELAFQPEIDVATLEPCLVEALLRWRLPDGRLACPEEFLGVAEESGLIMEISDWVMRSAIETASRWQRTQWPEARVAVNVSSRQLLDSEFLEKIQQLLCEYRLPTRCLEIELTENVLQTGPSTIEVLRRLRAAGMGIALDDFGTGYSSIASLEHLPLTRVKLDRSLIASIDKSARSLAITRAIIGLCRSLGLEITAEGVERTEQVALLLDQRGMYLQGYLLSRPVPSEELLPELSTISGRMESLLLSLPTARGGSNDSPRPRRRTAAADG